MGHESAGSPRADAPGEAPDESMAMVGHELRTPLGGIIGLSAMLLDTPLDSSQRATVHTIRTAAEHLAAVIERIAPHRDRRDGGAPAPMPFDPAVLATTVARLLEPQAAAKGLTLAVVGHRNLPALVSGDPVALRQILVNLVTNAVRATHEGSVTLRVRPERGTAALRFEVTDTGIGLTPTLEAALEGRAGTGGFGLRISRELVRGMGGDLHAMANPGSGATLWCVIPCQTVTVSPAAGQPRRNLARVLVAVDDELNAQVALSLLERLGYGVDIVASGTDALRAWGTRPYDLLLVDQQLPDLDGTQVARCVRELERADGRRITILGLTAGTRAVDRERCESAGMDATMAKPIQLSSLVTLLAEHSPPRAEPPAESARLVGGDLVRERLVRERLG
jgi:two-component system, sensor histidine kinase